MQIILVRNAGILPARGGKARMFFVLRTQAGERPAFPLHLRAVFLIDVNLRAAGVHVVTAAARAFDVFAFGRIGG